MTDVSKILIPQFVMDDIKKAKKHGSSLLEFGYEVNSNFSNNTYPKTVEWLYGEIVSDDDTWARERAICYAWMNPNEARIQLPKWIVVVNSNYYLVEYDFYTTTGVVKDCKLQRNSENKAIRFDDENSASDIASQINGVIKEVY